jgi:D-alanine-D-alanine ligase
MPARRSGGDAAGSRQGAGSPERHDRGLRVGIFRSRDVALAHGEARDALAVQAVGDEADAIEHACRANGWTPVAIEATTEPDRTLANLREARVDVVFQLVESIGGDARFEAAAEWLLEWARIPYTGTGPIATTIALQKPLARAVLIAHGVPVPRGFVVEQAGFALPDAFLAQASARWIVKPSREDASHGIAIESVVRGERELRARAEYVLDRYRQPALVEEFVDGREFNASILGEGAGAHVLPLAEIDYSGFPKGAPALVTFNAKWDPASPEYQGSMPVAATNVAPELEVAIQDAAVRAYNAIGLRGYGRIDVRVHPERGPLVLDVNPNPDISPDAGLARAAERGGLSYAQLIARIIDGARRTSGHASA